MKIVIDTNVVISALFFKGKPFELLRMVVNHSGGIDAFATPSILSEYIEVFQRMIDRKGRKKPEGDPLIHFLNSLSIIEDCDSVHASRDADDDIFISCAVNCKALYIVSGDNDLLDIEEFEGIQIVKVDEFLRIVQDQGGKQP